jgi:lysophospholipid acyltransferase (LPLAT)-like uncharacterized protein
MLFKKNAQSRALEHLKWRLIGLAGKAFIDLLFTGSKISIGGQAPIEGLLKSRRYLFALWHSRLLLPSYYFKGLNATAMVSNSADGEIIAQILKRQGQVTVRGSTGKGGLRALTQQIHDLRKNHRPGVVVPDGPQGPRHKVQQGIIILSQKTGYPIIPLTYSAGRRWVLNSWDRFIMPYPSTSCHIQFGRPIQVPADSNAHDIARYMVKLELELNRITSEADLFFGHRFEC